MKHSSNPSLEDLLRWALKSTRTKHRVYLKDFRLLTQMLLAKLGEQVVDQKRRVRIPDFGTFYLSVMQPKKVINPITKEVILTATTWRLGFAAAKAKKGRLT